MTPTEALAMYSPQLCYILDGFLGLYGLIITAMFINEKVCVLLFYFERTSCCTVNLFINDILPKWSSSLKPKWREPKRATAWVNQHDIIIIFIIIAVAIIVCCCCCLRLSPCCLQDPERQTSGAHSQPMTKRVSSVVVPHMTQRGEVLH